MLVMRNILALLAIDDKGLKKWKLCCEKIMMQRYAESFSEIC
jgi:hypothetical protein